MSQDILPDSSTRRLEPAELAQLDDAMLRIARNEIYARHGCTFRSPDLIRLFAQRSWYRPTRTAAQAEGELDPVERANVALIVATEAWRKAGR